MIVNFGTFTENAIIPLVNPIRSLESFFQGQLFFRKLYLSKFEQGEFDTIYIYKQ